MDIQQVLKVTVKVSGAYGNEESFYAKMNRDGRITLPKLTLDLLQDEEEGEQGLVGSILEVDLEPAEDSS